MTHMNFKDLIASASFWIDTTFGSLPFLALILAAIIIPIILALN